MKTLQNIFINQAEIVLFINLREIYVTRYPKLLVIYVVLNVCIYTVIFSMDTLNSASYK